MVPSLTDLCLDHLAKEYCVYKQDRDIRDQICQSLPHPLVNSFINKVVGIKNETVVGVIDNWIEHALGGYFPNLAGLSKVIQCMLNYSSGHYKSGVLFDVSKSMKTKDMRKIWEDMKEKRKAPQINLEDNSKRAKTN